MTNARQEGGSKSQSAMGIQVREEIDFLLGELVFELDLGRQEEFQWVAFQGLGML